KEKGDLLEGVANDLLKAQSYEVATQVRLTACELDLLCEHKVSGKTIYVECKAHREPLPADSLTKLLGTVSLKEYEEGWLISTGPLGKDAKGFLVEWEKKPQQHRSKLCIYTPERLVQALQDAGKIVSKPDTAAAEIVGAESRIGEWILLFSPWGTFWVCTCLESGIPRTVL